MFNLKSSMTTAFLSLVFFIACANAYAGSENTDDGNLILSDAETESLLFMREEEKLARDVYLTFYDLWNDEIFLNISDSEQEHMDAIKQLLDKYDLEDPIIAGVGLFNNADLQTLFDTLVARGEKSIMDALYVGALIEEVDMRDIQEAIDEASQPDIIAVYENLLKGSRNHLRAFVEKIEAEGVDYEAQVLTQEEVDEIADSPIEQGHI